MFLSAPRECSYHWEYPYLSQNGKSSTSSAGRFTSRRMRHTSTHERTYFHGLTNSPARFHGSNHCLAPQRVQYIQPDPSGSNRSTCPNSQHRNRTRSFLYTIDSKPSITFSAPATSFNPEPPPLETPFVNAKTTPLFYITPGMPTGGVFVF